MVVLWGAGSTDNSAEGVLQPIKCKIFPESSKHSHALRSIATGSRERAPDDRLRDASRRMDARHGLAAILRDARIGDARAPPIRAPQDEGFLRSQAYPDEKIDVLTRCFFLEARQLMLATLTNQAAPLTALGMVIFSVFTLHFDLNTEIVWLDPWARTPRRRFSLGFWP